MQISHHSKNFQIILSQFSSKKKIILKKNLISILQKNCSNYTEKKGMRGERTTRPNIAANTFHIMMENLATTEK